MRFLLNLFAPAPFIEPIKDEKKIQASYKYWKWRIFLGMYVGYALFYLTRKSFVFVMPVMEEALGLTKAQLGLVGSILYISYGASKFFSGILADRSNPRYFMGAGLIATGIFNIFFGLTSSFVLFALFWGLNGFFQGWGWPPCARLLMHWYPQSERGRWWGFWNTSHNIGGGIIPLLAASIAIAYGWRYAMAVPGVLAIGAGFFLIFCLRDTPQSLGLPVVEDPVEEGESKSKPEPKVKERELSTKEILFKYVLKNPLIWILAGAYFFVYVVRTAVNDWGLVFLIQEKGISTKVAASSIFMFEIGGALGALAAGWISDKIFKGRRGPVNVIYCLLILASVFTLWKLPYGNGWLSALVFSATGFIIFGPQMMIGMAAAELSHKKAAGTSTGFIGWFAYFGAAVGVSFCGNITQTYGWDGFLLTMAICGGIAALFLLPLWSIKANPKHALSAS